MKELESYKTRGGDVIEVGSIIAAYRPGYHVVTKIIDRSQDLKYANGSPLVHYMPLLSSKGTKAPKSPQICDAAYCSLASRHIPEKIKELEDHIAALKAFQVEHGL